MEDKNSKLKSSLKRFLTRAWDLFILNVLWIVCILPIVTAGPATCALFSILFRIIKGEQVNNVKEFFLAIRNNFKRGLILGLTALAAGAVIYADFVYAFAMDGSMKTVFTIVSCLAALLWLIFTTYSFALQARFENTLRGHIRNAFAMAICAPGKTVSMWMIYAFPILLVLVMPDIAITYLGWIYFMFGASLPFYWSTRVLSTIFDKFSGGKENEQTESETAG